jgi:hypothetical protein
MRASVLKGWQQSYDPALKVARGDQVLVVKRDSGKWAGWIWCTDKSGLSGWLPEQVFDAVVIGEKTIAAQDFDTIELTVFIGEILFVSNRLSEWSWCHNTKGQEGWVPDVCLTHVIDAA